MGNNFPITFDAFVLMIIHTHIRRNNQHSALKTLLRSIINGDVV